MLGHSADVAQLARASPCHGEGRGFEPLHPLPLAPRAGSRLPGGRQHAEHAEPPPDEQADASDRDRRHVREHAVEQHGRDDGAVCPPNETSAPVRPSSTTPRPPGVIGIGGEDPDQGPGREYLGQRSRRRSARRRRGARRAGRGRPSGDRQRGGRQGEPAAPQEADGLAAEADEALVPAVGRRPAQQARGAIPEAARPDRRAGARCRRRGAPPRTARCRPRPRRCRSTAAVVSSAWDSPPMASIPTAATAKSTLANDVPDRRRGASDRHLLDREAPAPQHGVRERDADRVTAGQHARQPPSRPARARAHARRRGPEAPPSRAGRTSPG